MDYILLHYSSTITMMRFVLLSLLATGVIAFAPLQQTSTRISSTALSAVDPKKEIGVLPPIGYFEYVNRLPYQLSTYHLTNSFPLFCSPLNLIEKGPYGNKFENFRHYRGIEVKHGRT